VRAINAARGNLAGTIACLAIAILFLIPAVPNAAAQSPEITFRAGIPQSLSTNPLAAGPGSWNVLGLIYEGATARNPETGELVPYIAVGSGNTSTSANISWSDCDVGNFGYSPKATWANPAKPEIVIFYDFENVRWHDGVPMTARDIMFSFHVHSASQDDELGHPLKDQNGKRTGNYSDTNWLHIQKAWESLDGSRAALKFTLQAPRFSVFQNYLENYILPYHIWGGSQALQFVEGAKIWCDPGYNKSLPDSWKGWMADRWSNPAPVGSGRFRWESASASEISLAPWEGHFYRPGFKYYSSRSNLPGAPSISRISLAKYQSEFRATMDLELGKLDLIAWPAEPESINKFANNPDVLPFPLTSSQMTYLAFNMGSKSLGYVPGAQLSSVVDAGKPLRRAIAHCVDSIYLDSMVGMAGSAQTGPLSSWENASAPDHTFDPPEGMNILKKSGFMLTNASMPAGEGNWWLNPDGSQIGRGFGGKLEVLVAQAETDDRTANRAASLVVSHMRSMGLNAELVELEYAILEQKILQRDFDICILGQEFSELQSSRPENYLFTHLHSMSIYDGSNFIGYRNASLDSDLAAAMATPYRSVEAALLADAFSSISFDVPFVRLYNQPVTELYRADTFAGFADDGSGSLLNPLSMASIVRENRQALIARFMNIPLTASSNSTLELRIKVTDKFGTIIQGAEVKLDSTSGSFAVLEGITDSQGMLTVNFTMPYVQERQKNGSALMLSIVSASRDGYRDAPARQALVTVYPEGTMLLSVIATALQDVVTATDISGLPGFTFIDILVLDEKNLPVPDASVTITIEGAAMVPETGTGLTDQEGYLRLRLTAPDVGAPEECVITITASKVAHLSGSAQVSVMVIPNTEPPLVEQPGNLNPAYAIIPVVLVLGAIAYLWWKKGRKAA
jgi:ABC-type transport system substrate-binding protein